MEEPWYCALSGHGTHEAAARLFKTAQSTWKPLYPFASFLLIGLRRVLPCTAGMKNSQDIDN
jgi:hypothetical protein